MEDIALSEVIGALSYALDITEGQPAGHAVRSCMIGMRIAEELQLPARTRSDLFYALLLKDAGCSANAERMTALFGADDRAAKRTSKLIDWASPWQAFVWSLRTVAPDGSRRARLARLRGIKDEGEVTRKFMEARCDRGAEIARMLYLSEATAAAIRSLDEHWDGRGMPDGLRGEEIPLLARILCLAQTAEIFHAAGGVDAARRVARKRRGRWFDPALVDALLAVETRILDDARASRRLGRGSPPTCCSSPTTRGSIGSPRRSPASSTPSRRSPPGTPSASPRSPSASAPCCGSTPSSQRDLRRAGLLHDIGKLAISNLILDKPGKLTDDEFGRVKEHPAYSLAILERAPCFAAIAPLAANHHERIDGSGYPRRLAGEQLDMPMRVLAVADVYEALTADRPYRGPLPVEKALDIVAWEVPGRLDGDAFRALEAYLGRTTDPLAPGVLTVAPPEPSPARTGTPPGRAKRPG